MRSLRKQQLLTIGKMNCIMNIIENLSFILDNLYVNPLRIFSFPVSEAINVTNESFVGFYQRGKANAS